MLEQKHPNLKKLLVLFIAVFIILVGLAGLKLYLDVSKSSDEPAMRDGGSPSGRPTEADIEQQLKALDTDAGERPNEESISMHLDVLNQDSDAEKRPSEEDVRKQLDALNQE